MFLNAIRNQAPKSRATLRLLPLLAATLMLGAPAEAARVKSGMVVDDLGGGNFQVRFRATAGERDYWCAAGQYGRRLRMGATDRIWRVSPPPLKAGQHVVFSTSPANSAGRTGIATFGGTQDGSFSVSTAEEFCNLLQQQMFDF